ncbi:hypothetical protein OSTOST_24004, partial [Ostertagia ostertagi]
MEITHSLTSMRLRLALACLAISTLVTGHDDVELFGKSAQPIEVNLVDTRNILRTRLEECISGWESEITIRDELSVFQYWDLAHRIARKWHPESMGCLGDLQPLLRKYKRILLIAEKRKDDGEGTKIGLNTFLNRGQIQELQHMHEYGNSDAVEEA